jgi:sec-independent protein translocase protein TatC
MPLWRRQQHTPLNPDDVRMTLGEHLEELRSRLIRAILALAVGAVICFIYSDEVLAFLCAPIFAILREQGYPQELPFFNPAEAFMISIKVSIIVGFILSAPYGLTQIWGFVAAGLYIHERKWVRRFAPASIILFFVGALFLLLIVSPVLYRFLLSYQTHLPDRTGLFPAFLWRGTGRPAMKTDQKDTTWPAESSGPAASRPEAPASMPSSRDLAHIPAFEKDPKDPPEGVPWLNTTARRIHIRYGDKVYSWTSLSEVDEGPKLRPDIRISENIIFMLELSAAFGITFQIPVIVAFLAAVGIVSAAQMAGMRRYIWFGMSIAAAVITPTTDVASMMLMMVPMVLLFEVGLWVARILERGRSTRAPAGEEPPAGGD